MTARTQLWCAWAGPAFAVLLGVGFWGMAGLLPPPSPNDSAGEVRALYADGTGLIQAGLLVAALGGCLYVPWTVAWWTQLRRIESGPGTLAVVQLGAGFIATVFVVLPPMLMEAAAFRTTRDPDSVLVLHDVAWLIYVGLAWPFVLQAIAIGACILRAGHQGLFPRWAGYFSLWAAVTFMPAVLVVFFKQGAFAWRGAVSFWIGLGMFAIWIFVMTRTLDRAIRQASEAPLVSHERHAAPTHAVL